MSPHEKIRPERDNHKLDMFPLNKISPAYKKSLYYRIAPPSERGGFLPVNCRPGDLWEEGDPIMGHRMASWRPRAQSAVCDRSFTDQQHPCILLLYLLPRTLASRLLVLHNVFSCLPPSIHVTSAADAAARIRLSSVTVGVRGERSVTGPVRRVPAAWPGERSRHGPRPPVAVGFVLTVRKPCTPAGRPVSR